MSTVVTEIHDISNCENEPIRFTGAVQPHGTLLVVQPETGLIEAASESCSELIDLPAESLLGKALADFSAHQLEHHEEVAQSLPEGGNAQGDDEERRTLEQPAAQAGAELAEQY